MIVIDASAALELLLRTERGSKIRQRIFTPRESLHAPHLIDIEVAQTLRRLVKLKEVTAIRCKHALEDHAALNIKRAEHKDFLERAWTLRDSLTAYEAAYVILAEVLDAPLITCDAKLARSHGHEARVELVK